MRARTQRACLAALTTLFLHSAAARDGRPGGDGLLDLAITVVFGGALLLSAAYTLASFATVRANGDACARARIRPPACLPSFR